jgi:hypothetical protein
MTERVKGEGRDRRKSQPHQIPPVTPIWGDEMDMPPDTPSIRVQQFVIEEGGRTRYMAELRAVGCGIERAVVDAGSQEELRELVKSAVRGFALAIRLRVQARAAANR